MVRPFRATSLDLRAGGIFVATTVLLGLSGVSCNKMPLTAPSGSAITLVASTNTLPVNGSTDITAVVIEGGASSGAGGATTVTAGAGTPVQNGTQVSFTTTLGQIQPGTAETHDGKAVVTLSGDGRSGTATITAISGAASKTMTVAIGAAGASRIAVTANPEALPATGGTSTIVASVQDAQGNGLLGVPVSFSTSAGTLSATTVVTDAGGNATTQLTTSVAATVTASSGGATAALTGTVNVTLNSQLLLGVTAPASVTVSVPAAFTVTVSSTGTGTTFVKDAVVDFGDGTAPVPLGQISSTTPAPAPHLFAKSGSLTMTVTATDPTGQQTVIHSPVIVAPLSAVPAANPTSTTVGSSILFTVTPVTGALIDHYVWDFGDLTPPVTSQSNALPHAYVQRGTYTATVTVFPVAGPPLTALPIPVQIN
jgi:Bacterial Ig-like domain (group 1)/PKD domain